MDKIKSRTAAHVVYKLSDGTRVPGATTITGLLNKPYLIVWANRLGLEGVDSTKYRDEAADIGTLAHAMIQAHINRTEMDTSAFSPAQVDAAENAVLSYLEWEKGHTVKPLVCEIPMVSEKHRFGGTVDCYCELDGVPTLVDFKTGKAIYSEYFVQVSGYKVILEEHGYPVEDCRILRVGRDENEGFEDHKIQSIDKYFDIFKHLLSVYYDKKELGWN